MSNRGGPVVLIVLDGWGYRPQRDGNAIELGDTPTWHQIWQRAPHTLLQASGEAVGLPHGQMGNSEVGHLNLGAGRIVSQDIVRITDSIVSGEFYHNKSLRALADGVTASRGTLHLVGLIGPGGVHAHEAHWDGLMELARRSGVPRVALHAFLDGRDTPPTSAADYVRALVNSAQERSDNKTQCFIASATGRYYAMDRDKRWDRTKLAYDSMVSGTGVRAAEPVAAIERCYERGETDEFIKPIVMLDGAQPRALIRSGDGVIGVNFRADRMRQIVSALALPGFDEFDVHNRPRIELATMTEYDQTFPFAVGFGTRSISRILAEVISDADLTQLRTAETEKYAHVTYFFNGGYEVPYAGESRKLVPSQKVATYDLKPEMSAQSITDTLCQALERGEHHFYLCNYANGDMVGHTGVLEAAIQATSTVDECITRVLTAAEKVHATVIITADHGNCELMIDPASGGPHTAHTTNLVPLVIVGDDRLTQLRSGGSLRDVAPTVLRYLGVDVPTEMTGVDIREGIN